MKIIQARCVLSDAAARWGKPEHMQAVVRRELAYKLSEELVKEESLYTVEESIHTLGQIFTITVRIENI